MSPKRLRCLHELADAHKKSVPKSTKAGGTGWLDFKYNAIKNALDYYDVYLTHGEELVNINTQLKKQAELAGFFGK